MTTYPPARRCIPEQNARTHAQVQPTGPFRRTRSLWAWAASPREPQGVRPSNAIASRATASDEEHGIHCWQVRKRDPVASDTAVPIQGRLPAVLRTAHAGSELVLKCPSLPGGSRGSVLTSAVSVAHAYKRTEIKRERHARTACVHSHWRFRFRFRWFATHPPRGCTLSIAAVLVCRRGWGCA